MTKIIAGAAVIIMGVPITIAGIDPVGDILKAGGTAGLEITIIVLGFFITIATFRLLTNSIKSAEHRIDALIEANERYAKSTLEAMEIMGQLRQSVMVEAVRNLLLDIAAIKEGIGEVRNDIKEFLDAAEGDHK